MPGAVKVGGEICTRHWPKAVEHHQSGVATDRHAAQSSLDKPRGKQIKQGYWRSAE